jgi:peptidoglycan hydrolase-like protein with peptidoglycan-binding domain
MSSAIRQRIINLHHSIRLPIQPLFTIPIRHSVDKSCSCNGSQTSDAGLARAQALARTWQPKPENVPQRSQPAVLQDDAPTRIRRAQDRLTALGFAPGPVDGVLGPRMRTALQQFQRRHRLPVTGALDAAMWRALEGR